MTFSPSRFVIALLRLYQIIISPLLGPRCRFHPTCSNYTIKAIQKYGFFKGSILSLKRIIRCRPGCACGVDEVP